MRYIYLPLLAMLAILFSAPASQAQNTTTLYQQDGPISNDRQSVFIGANSYWTAHDSFAVPMGETWNITQLTFTGITATTPAPTFEFRFHLDNSGAPGAAVCTSAATPTTSTYVEDAGPLGFRKIYNHSATLNAPCVLEGGVYWLAVTADQITWNWATYSTLGQVVRDRAFQVGRFNRFNTDIFNNEQAIFALIGSIPGDGEVLTPSTAALGCGVLDGRSNADPLRDCAPPVLVYCHSEQIDIHHGDGAYLMSVSWELLHNTEIPQGDHTTITQSDDGSVIISLLTTGEYQLNTWYYDPYWPNNSKPYILTWDAGCRNFKNISP